MLRKPHYIGLLVVVVIVVVLFKLPGQTAGRLKLAISGLFLPLFGLAGSTHEAAVKSGNTFKSRRELLAQNQQLRRQNQELQFRLRQETDVWQENARLRQLAGWPRQVPWQLKLGRVIAHDPANWWRSLQIDLGTRDGLRNNLPVLTPEGLVGRVQAAGETRSQVILLGDPNLRVAALIETTRETGVIMASSSSPQENNMVDLGFLSGNSLASPGQSVITSGDGGVFPKGIPIGRIVDLRTKDYGLSKEARVKLWANLSALEEVWVLLPENPEVGSLKPEVGVVNPAAAKPRTSNVQRPTSNRNR